MAKSNPSNLLASGSDPYLALNDKIDAVVSDVETLAGKKAEVPFDPSLLRALLEVMREMKKAIGAPREGQVIQVAPAAVEIPAANVTVNIDTAKEWEVSVTEREDNGRAKRYHFKAL